MTLPPVIRIFFAIEIPPVVRAEVNELINQLKKKTKSNPIRWTRPENLHITLQFLPIVQTQTVATLLANVQAKIADASLVASITFDQLYLFPNPYRPRVVVLGVAPQAPLVTLASLIGTGIKESGYPIETRPFRAHLTLGRIKHMQSINPGGIIQTPFTISEQFNVAEVVLFRSEPRPEGSTYTVLQRIALADKGEHKADMEMYC